MILTEYDVVILIFLPLKEFLSFSIKHIVFFFFNIFHQPPIKRMVQSPIKVVRSVDENAKFLIRPVQIEKDYATPTELISIQKEMFTTRKFSMNNWSVCVHRNALMLFLLMTDEDFSPNSGALEVFRDESLC